MKKLLLTAALVCASVASHASGNDTRSYGVAAIAFVEAIASMAPLLSGSATIGLAPDYLLLGEESTSLRQIDAQHGAAIGGLAHFAGLAAAAKGIAAVGRTTTQGKKASLVPASAAQRR